MAKQRDIFNLAKRAQHYGPDALKFLGAVFRGELKFVDADGRTLTVEPGTTAERIKAADLLLTRGFGRPKETVELTGGEEEDGTSKAIKVAVVHIRREVDHDEAD
jgi:hypothetical protein